VIGRRDGLYAQKLVTVHTAWVQRGWSAFHRSLNPFENILSPSNVGGLEEDWTVTMSQPLSYGSPIVPSGSRQVIVAEGLGEVRAVSEVTGATVWSQSGLFPGGPNSTPAVDSGRVYVNFTSGVIYALSAATGAIVWQTSIGIGPGSGSSSPTVAANVVYVGSGDGNLYALNGTTGALIWKGTTGGTIYSSPAVSGGRVFVGSNDGSLYAFAVGCATGGASCAPLWSSATTGAVQSSPAVSNGVVFVGSNDAKLYAVNATTGALAWVGTLPAIASLASPAIANGVVYMPSFAPGVLSAFPTACGTGGASCSPLWQSGAVGYMQSTPAIANGVVYVSGNGNTNDGLVMAFPATCTSPCAPRWTALRSASNFPSSPVVSDGMVIEGDAGGSLTAWDLPAVTHAPQPTRPNPSALKPDLTLRPIH
jgi:outer membrane protein assembly factor BamB